MKLIDELKWRGLIYDIIDEENLTKRLEDKPITVYCGFDPTADSMHIGSLLPIITLVRFHDAGHRIIALTGGGTGMIGDPSGKKNERSLNSPDVINKWCNSFKEQFSRFIPFNDRTAFSIDNNDWLGEMKAIELWRDYGKHFNINYMLAKESVKSRLDSGLTYLEFSYMIMQSIDFLKMYQDKTLKCEMQIGGQDQWGNITAGMELIRKIEGPLAKTYGLTMPLVTKADGTKFGKTESGAIWLDKEKTSPYEMYQFFINTADDDVIKLLMYYTFLSKKEIEELEESTKAEPHLRLAQKKLAEEVVKMVHGEEALNESIKITNALFSGDIKTLNVKEIKEGFKNLPFIEISLDTNIIDVLILANAAASKREARQFLTNNAIYVNGELVNDFEALVKKEKAFGEEFSVIRRGKKNYYWIKHN